jgi:hemolysin activation/secretion protein
VVNIRVLEGRLEKVQTSGNKMYSDQALARPFKPLLGELVTIGRTENALLTLTKYPGLSAAGVFRPGEDVGTTDIVVNVQNETRVDGDARYDNEGTSFTGRKRLVGSADVNDLFGDADLLTLTALHTFGAETNTGNVVIANAQKGGSNFGELRYSHPLFSAYDRWAVDVSRNSFSVGGLTPVGGISKIGAFSWEHDFTRSREFNMIGTLDLSRKRADTLTNAASGQILTGRDDLAVLGYQLNIDSVNTASNTISSSYFRIDHGFGGVLGVPDTFSKPSRFGTCGQSCPAGPKFTQFIANYQLFKNLPDNQGLLFRANGQYSHDLLTSLQQYVMGGPDNVRAAPVSQFLTDRGLFGSFEYSVRAPGFSDKHAFGSYTWGQVLRFRIFEDAAKGWINDPPAASSGVQSSHSLAGWGLGVEFNVPGTVTANLQWAHLNGGARKGSGILDPNAISDASETWFDLTVDF